MAPQDAVTDQLIAAVPGQHEVASAGLGGQRHEMDEVAVLDQWNHADPAHLQTDTVGTIPDGIGKKLQGDVAFVGLHAELRSKGEYGWGAWGR